jgi:hypothetical protein
MAIVSQLPEEVDTGRDTGAAVPLAIVWDHMMAAFAGPCRVVLASGIRLAPFISPGLVGLSLRPARQRDAA